MDELPKFNVLDITDGESVANIELVVNKYKFSPNAKRTKLVFGTVNFVTKYNNNNEGCNSNNEDITFTRNSDGCEKSKSYNSDECENKYTDICTQTQSFGLPLVIVKRGKHMRFRFTNYTGYSTNLHIHGGNVPANMDGATEILSFGIATSVGPVLELNYHPVTNNSSLIWMHSHSMFLENEFVYTGIYGLIVVIDDISEKVNNNFNLYKNYFPLTYECANFHPDGTLDNRNLNVGGERSCFGLIDGTSAVNWTSNKEANKYISRLKQVSSSNITKIDIVNGTGSFRVIYVGVCDREGNIKTFHLVQSDDGYRNPIELTMISIFAGSRIGIIIDLNEFKCKEAFIFFYNFDLTEISNLELVGNTLIADTPDLKKSKNPTPNPTPIPGPDSNLDISRSRRNTSSLCVSS